MRTMTIMTTMTTSMSTIIITMMTTMMTSMSTTIITMMTTMMTRKEAIIITTITTTIMTVAKWKNMVSALMSITVASP